MFVLIRLRGELGGGGFDDLIGLRGKHFGVVRDEVLMHPLRAAGFDPQVEESRFGGFDKFARASSARFSLALLRAAGIASFGGKS